MERLPGSWCGRLSEARWMEKFSKLVVLPVLSHRDSVANHLHFETAKCVISFLSSFAFSPVRSVKQQFLLRGYRGHILASGCPHVLLLSPVTILLVQAPRAGIAGTFLHAALLCVPLHYRGCGFRSMHCSALSVPSLSPRLWLPTSLCL